MLITPAVDWQHVRSPILFAPHNQHDLGSLAAAPRDVYAGRDLFIGRYATFEDAVVAKNTLTVGVGAVAGGAQVILKTMVNAADYGMYTVSSTFDGVTEDLIYWGYNIGNVANQPLIFHSFETNYNDVGVGFSWAEWNFEYTPPDHLTKLRPLNFQVKRTDGSIWNWQFRIGQNTSNFKLQNYLGTVDYVVVDQAGLAEFKAGIYADYGTVMRLGTTRTHSAFIMHGATSDPSLTKNTACVATIGTGGYELAMGQMASSPYNLWMQVKHAAADISGPLLINPLGGFVGIGITAPASRLDIGAGAVTLAEMSAPAAPAANNLVLYAVDNGGGKTQLMVRFPTGVAQQIAIEA